MGPTIAIIGAGAGGIAMGVRLRRAGFDRFTIFEKSDGVGGTWRDNTYPGAACDVPSHLYSFSWEPNPYWQRTFATQPEILAYLEHCATEHGLRPHLRLGTEVRTVRWDDERRHWTLETATGEVFRAHIVISALGMLNIPYLPEIPGRDRFQGTQFHSARWQPDAPIEGARVAVVGTGASAIQFVPAIAPAVASMTVFQRTPTWIRPKVDVEVPAEDQERFARRPLAGKVERWKAWWTYERNNAIKLDSPTSVTGTEFCRSYLERKVEDEELRAALTPDHPLGCKRPLLSRDWYPALTRPNVRVATSPIVEIDETGLTTADGEHHEVDTIVYGTGFRANEYLSAIDVYGREGRRLHDDWKDGAEAYLGTTVAGFPNFFVMYGPNTNGVNSILFIHEAQAHYVERAIKALRRRRGRTLEVKESAMRAYNDRIQEQLQDTVWTACDNYFKASDGRIVTQMPFSGGIFWLRTRVFRARDYVIR